MLKPITIYGTHNLENAYERLSPNTSKLAKLVKWKSNINFEEGIKKRYSGFLSPNIVRGKQTEIEMD